jgi:hypothetical protein
MANPTSNYGWVLPTSTDLVTDLPADFDVALQGVDNTTKALNPETTLGDIAYRSATANTNTRLPIGTAGQVLGVSGGVPAWVTSADQTPLTTKGDLFTFTTVDARIGVGANDTVLETDSAQATGLKWAAPTPVARNWSLLNSGGTALTGATTVTVSGISGKDNILIMVKGAGNTTVSTQYKFRFNADTGSNYYYAGNLIIGGSTYDPLNFKSLEMDARDAITYGASSSDTSSKTNGFCFITGANSAGVKAFQVSGGGTPPAASSGQWLTNVGGYYNSATTISSISVVTSGSNFSAGTVYVYTSA